MSPADLVGFLEDAVDGRAVHRLGLDAVHLEHLLDALDVALGLLEVLLEAGLQIARSVALSIIFGSAFSICFSA